jgi:hypothetical protein
MSLLAMVAIAESFFFICAMYSVITRSSNPEWGCAVLLWYCLGAFVFAVYAALELT